jgi:hypothetical protein
MASRDRAGLETRGVNPGLRFVSGAGARIDSSDSPLPILPILMNRRVDYFSAGKLITLTPNGPTDISVVARTRRRAGRPTVVKST